MLMTASQLCRFSICTGTGAVLLIAMASAAIAEEGLSQQLAAAPEGATVDIPVGILREPLAVDRSLTLRGVSPEQSVLEVTANQPALSISDKAEVVVEAMTIRWQLDTSEPAGRPSAVFVKDATLTLRNCRIIAPAGGKRCPSAVAADGFSRLTIEDCTIEGFEFAVNVGGGAEARVVDSLLRKPGHCGLSVFSDSKLAVARCIIAESAYHALRSTGGTLDATDNLILNNKNRGIYLGNKSAMATIRGNVFLGNATGISSFAQSEAVIESNVFLDSSYTAIDSRETCRLTIDGNILQGNQRGLVLYSETGEHRLQVGANTFWNNGVDVENIELPEGSLAVDPKLADAQEGRFEAGAGAVQSAGHGLGEKAASAKKLWQRWQQQALQTE